MHLFVVFSDLVESWSAFFMFIRRAFPLHNGRAVSASITSGDIACVLRHAPRNETEGERTMRWSQMEEQGEKAHPNHNWKHTAFGKQAR